MPIQEYTDDKGQILFKIKVRKRSKVNPSIRLQESKSGFTTRKSAEKAEKTLLREIERKLFELENKGLVWQYVIDDWYEAFQSGCIFTKQITPSVGKDYFVMLKSRTRPWFRYHVSEIDQSMGWTLLDQVERSESISRRKRLASAIRTVYEWLLKKGYAKDIRCIPVEGFRSTTKEEEKMPEILTLAEMRQFLHMAKEQEHPWYPVWAFHSLTGLRSGEGYALLWENVDMDAKVINVHRNWTNKSKFGPTKGRYWRVVPISSDLYSLLLDLRAKRTNEFVLPRFQSWKDGRQADILRTFCKGNGLPSIKFHTLRSCFATQLIRDGIAPAIIMKICGWKDLKTMQRYIRLAGIEVSGATEGLKLLPDREVMGRVVELFRSK